MIDVATVQINRELGTTDTVVYSQPTDGAQTTLLRQ